VTGHVIGCLAASTVVSSQVMKLSNASRTSGGSVLVISPDSYLS
jgi:hypothetical protein